MTFDTVDISSSIPASMPALTVLALIGLVGVVRSRAARGATLAALRAPAIGAAAAWLVTLTIAFVAHRYLSDFVPLLVLLGAAGLHLLLRWSRTPTPRRRAVRLVWGLLAVLLVLSVWINLGLAVLYQRKLNPGVPDSELASFLRLQYDVHRRFPGGSPPDVERGTALPRDPAAAGTLFVIGACRGLYFSVGYAWRALERTPETGHRRLRVRFPDEVAPERQPILTTGVPGAADFVAARVVPGGRVQFSYLSEGVDEPWHDGPPLRLPADREVVLDVVQDTRTGRVEVALDGRPALGITALVRQADNATVGRNELGGPLAPAFSGAIEELPVEPRLCRTLSR